MAQAGIFARRGGATGQGRLGPGDILVLLGVVALVAIAASVLTRDRLPAVDRSAIGSRALVSWLKANDLDAHLVGLGPVDRAAVGLRVLPVLDTAPGVPFVAPDTAEAYLATGTERDIGIFTLVAKQRRAPTLVVAPKWTRAMRVSGYAHKSLLLSPQEASGGLDPLDLHLGPLVRPDRLTQTVTYRDSSGTRHEGLLYAPQLFPDRLREGCAPIISAPGGHLLISCEIGDVTRAERRLWALSDPDLISNHGLRLGGNGPLVAALMADLSRGGQVIVDVSDEFIIFTDPGPPPPRDWGDLGRLLAWPYTVIWVALGALCALVLWRAWVRIGAPRHLFDDRLSAARSVSIAAKARLLRLSGNQSPLLAAHIHARLTRLETQIFGGTPSADPQRRIIALLERAQPDLASAFAKSIAAASSAPADLGDAQMTRLLDSFETLAESVVHATR